MKTRLAIVAGLAAAAISSSAFAVDYTFSFNRSDLESRSGLERTIKRIEFTARNVCDVDTARDPAMRREARACAADVANDIVAKIGHGPLAAAWNDAKVFAAR